jgi:nitrous oxidase accessory protein NosD
MCNVRGSCIHAFGRKGLRFVDVYFHDFRNAADMCLYCQDCLVDRCLVTGTGGAGVRFDNSTRITITGNVIRMKTNYGLKLLTYYYKDDNPNPTPQVMTVVGNDISVEPLGPDYEDGDHGKGMMLWSIRDSRIEGNYIHSPTSTGPGIVIGVCEEKKDDPSMASSDNVIANNVVDLPFSLGYCLWVQNASKNMAVTGNIFTGGAKGVLGINPSCKEGLVSDRNILAKRADGRWIGDSLGGTDELRDKWLKGGLDTASNFAVMAAPQDREAAASAHKDDEYPGR